jgi:hypothetical protein
MRSVRETHEMNTVRKSCLSARFIPPSNEDICIEKVAVYRDVALCSPVSTDRRLGTPYYVHHQVDQRPDDGRSKHLRNVVSSFKPTERNIPEDSHLHTRRHKNQNS